MCHIPLSKGDDVGVLLSVTVTVTKVYGFSVLEGAGLGLGEEAAAGEEDAGLELVEETAAGDGVCVTTAVVTAGAGVSTIVVGNVMVFVRKMVVGSSDSVSTDVATCVVVSSCVRVMRFVIVAVGAESDVLPPSTATTE